MPLMSRAQRYLTLMNFMSSTNGHSTATMMCWMKKTTNAISDTGRKESVQVALLQTHGEDGASLLMLRWSLIGVSSVHCVQMCWKRSTYSFLDLKVLVLRHAKSEIFLRVLIHLDTDFLSSINFELRFTKYFIFQESGREFLQNPFLIHLFLELWAMKCSFCASVLPWRLPWGRTFLDDIVRYWENIQLPSVKMSAGFIFSQEMSTSAINYSLIPVKKSFWALQFGNCFASNSSTLPMSRIIFFDFSLNGL